MTDTQRSTFRRFAFAAVLLGAGFWVLDALLDHFYFFARQGTFLDLLVLNVPGHELYIRTTVLVGLFLGAVAATALTTRTRRTEQALQTAEHRLAAALESSLDTISITRLSDGRLTEMNKGFTEMFGYQPHEARGHTTAELGLWDDLEDRSRFFAQVLEKGSASLPQARMRHRDGSLRYASVTGTILEADGERHLLAIVRDITDLVTTRQELERSREHFYNVLESTTDAYFELDKDFTVTFLNSKAAAEMRRERDDILGRNLNDVLPQHEGSVFHQRYAEAMREQRTLEFEAQYEPYGLWVEVHAYPTPDRLSVYFHDITERKRESQRLEKALRQNEIMLREIHHRVKNNMQVVSSLLSLQSYSEGDPAELFRETQGRIRTMALVHEELYRSGDMSSIDFQDYARSLAERVLSAYAGDRGLAFDVDLDSLNLPLDRAVPLGLVLNELLTNAVRHGFPDGRAGRVRMQAHTLGEDIVLVVSDNGVGLPEGFSPASQRGLGTQIVQGLVEQLRGRLAYDRADPEGGARVTITLPKEAGT